MEELNEKMEQLQAMLEANISKMNKIVSEEHQKTFKEVEILNESAKRLNTSINDFESKITLLDEVIADFSPSVEVKHYSIDVKNPLYWILGAIAAILISFLVCLNYYNQKEAEKALKEEYKQSADMKDWNYMKYKYLLLFGSESIQKTLKDFDKVYDKNYVEFDKKIIKREYELKAAARARDEANIRAKEAKALKQRADSLMNAE